MLNSESLSANSRATAQYPARVLRPRPIPFLLRGMVFALLGLVFLVGMRGVNVVTVVFALAAASVGILFATSSITLNEDGFVYRSLGQRRAVYRWADVDNFSVVTQRVLGFIPIYRWLGWNFSPEYRHYRRLAIPRVLTRAMDMADAMVDPLGYDANELASLMSTYLAQARQNRTLNGDSLA